MNNQKFIKKYNFNIEENENKIQEILKNNKPFKKYNYDITIIKNLKNIDFGITKNDKSISDKIEMKKIKLDNMTGSEILKKKIFLNFQLFKIFIDNLYTDEYNRSRRSFYFLFAFPSIVGASYYNFSPLHPSRSLVFNISILSSIILLLYNYSKDLEDIIHSDTEIGSEVI
jgi:hypothetical protein